VTRESAIGLAYLRETLGVSSVSELRGAILPVPLQRILDVLHLSQEQVFDAASKLVENRPGSGARDRRFWQPGRPRHGDHAPSRSTFLLPRRRAGRAVGGPGVRAPRPGRTQELTAEMRRVTRATVIGILATAVFQGVCAGAGYLFAGIPHPAFFGLLTAMVSFVPGVGTSLVWGPAAVSLWVGGARRAVRWRFTASWSWSARSRWASRCSCAARCRCHRAHLPLLLGGLAMFGLLGNPARP